MTDTPDRREPLLSIQYLRAFAALMVVFYHANRWAWRDFDIGAAGVDVFFVISGFVLWTSVAERPARPLTFLWRRIVRVTPLYWILTLGVTGAALLWPGLFWDADPTPTHVFKSLAFIQHMNPDGRPFPVISAGWSLNYEMLFYLVVTAALFMPPRERLAALIFGLVCVVGFGFLYPPSYFLGANPMHLQFAAGALLAEARMRGVLLGRKSGWVLVVIGVIGFAIASRFDLFEHLWRPLFWGLPAFLLVAGAVTVEGRGRLPNLPVFRFLGDASYSIYLCHIVVTELLTHVINAGKLIYLPIAIGASLVIGSVCYLVVERPLLRLFHAHAGGAVLRRRTR